MRIPRSLKASDLPLPLLILDNVPSPDGTSLPRRSIVELAELIISGRRYYTRPEGSPGHNSASNREDFLPIIGIRGINRRIVLPFRVLFAGFFDKIVVH